MARYHVFFDVIVFIMASSTLVLVIASFGQINRYNFRWDGPGDARHCQHAFHLSLQVKRKDHILGMHTLAFDTGRAATLKACFVRQRTRNFRPCIDGPFI